MHSYIICQPDPWFVKIEHIKKFVGVVAVPYMQNAKHGFTLKYFFVVVRYVLNWMVLIASNPHQSFKETLDGGTGDVRKIA